MNKNYKTCVECGKKFPCSPSNNKVTCSDDCRRIHSSKTHSGRKFSETSRKKMSDKAKGRDMTALQEIAVNAAKNSPKSGRFETNINAVDWHLVSPDGVHYKFRSLNYWLRQHCHDFFGCEPDSREFNNVRSGIAQVKRSMLGKVSKNQRPGYTYRGWQVIPTINDMKGEK